MSRFIRDSLFGTMAGIATTFGNFVSSLVVSRVLGVEQAGTVAFAVWAVTLGTTFVSGGLPFTVARFLPVIGVQSGPTAARQLAARLLRPFALSSAGLAGVALLCTIWLVRGGEIGTSTPLHDPVILALVGATVVLQTLGDFARSALRGMQDFQKVARLTGGTALLQILALTCGSLTYGARGAIAGYLVATWLPLFVLREFSGPVGPRQPELMARMMRYMRFRWASELLGFLVWSRIEILFLQMFWGIGAVGLFSCGMTLANLAVQGPLMLTWALMPHFAELHGRQDRDSMYSLYATGTRLLAFLVCPACFGLAAVLPRLLPLLYGQAFVGAVPAAEVLICAASVSAVTAVGTNLVWGLERSDVDFYAGLTGACVAVIGGLTLIGPFGGMGAAWSRALTQTAAVSVSTWFLATRLGFAVPAGALLRLFAAALLCGATARGLILLVPGPLGLMVAIPAGATVYLAAVRAFGALTADDTARLRGLLRFLPWRLAQRAEPIAQFILG